MEDQVELAIKAPTGGVMIYVDTNIWVYAMTADSKYGEKCKRILEKLEKGEFDATISVQVLSEVADVLHRRFGFKDTTEAT